MNKQIVGYLCLYCGFREGEHAMLTYACRKQNTLSTDRTYSDTRYKRDINNPIYGTKRQ